MPMPMPPIIPPAPPILYNPSLIISGNTELAPFMVIIAVIIGLAIGLIIVWGIDRKNKR